jgi:ABC-type dipeptide/oligopeptide/nickel transport system permease component
MSLRRYAARRVVQAAITIFCIATFNFVLFRALPGSYISNISHIPDVTPAFEHSIAQQFGLDRPKWAQYLIYLGQLARGNLGVSYINQQPVLHNLLGDLANTVPMVGLGILVAIVAGVIGGVLSAWRRNGPVDRTVTGFGIVTYSLPPQWIGLLLIFFLGAYLPTFGIHSVFLLNDSWWARVSDEFDHMILPSLTVALALVGQFILITRAAVLDALGDDYVLTARAKGMRPLRIVWRHAVPNALLPIVTVIALTCGYIVGGAVLIETVFSWPGIGLAVYQAVQARDYPTLQGAFLLLAISVVLFNLAADVLYFRLDPRVRV